MSGQTSFGRRQAAPATLPVWEPAPPAPQRAVVAEPAPGDLSAAAEAFRSEVAAGRGREGQGFESWKRSQNDRLALVWLVRIVLLSPGLLTLLLHAPHLVSIGLEGAGIGASAWLRRERRQRLARIAAWSDGQEAA